MIRRRLVRGTILASLCVAATMVSSQASAQVLDRPPRVFRGLFAGGPPPDPNRPRHELTLNSSVLGGTDDGTEQPGVGSPDGSTQAFFQGSVNVKYSRGRATRSFAVEGSVYGFDTPNVGFSHGTVALVSGSSQLRARDTIQFEQRVSFDPVMTVDTIQPVDGTPPTQVVTPGAPSDPVYGILERTTWTSQTTATYDWALTRTTPLSLGYGFHVRQRTADEDVGGNVGTHRFSASLAKALNRAFSMQFGYGFSRTTLEDEQSVSTPLTQQTFSVGPQYSKRLSRNRRLVLSGSLGGQHVSTFGAGGLRATEVQYWTPYGQGTARIDIAKSWALWADYRRGSTIAEAVSAQTYASDAVSMSIGGLVGTRLDLAFTGGLSGGRDGSQLSTDASYTTSTYAVQARLALTSRLSTVISFSHYDYKFSNTSDLPDSFDPSSRRNSLRVGINLWLPLIGTYTDGAH